jgi:hypothetical protein
MKQTEVKVDEWSGFDEAMAQGDRFFQPVVNETYRLVFRSAKPAAPDEKFKDQAGKPKLRIHLTLESMNGVPSQLEWTTGSFTIMREIRTAQKAGKLNQTEWLFKRKDENGKTKYIFEKIREFNSPLPRTISNHVDRVMPELIELTAKKHDDVEAFL